MQRNLLQLFIINTKIKIAYNKRIISSFIILGLLLLYGNCLSFAATISPLNNRILDNNQNAYEYSFIVVGHIYGAPENSNSIFPASSFTANIDRFNSAGIRFMVLLGDFIRRPTQQSISVFRNYICLKINVPVFNVVGNHDVMDRRLYENNFGKTYYDIQQGKGYFIFLDSEIDKGNITGRQLSFFEETINKLISNNQITSIFIFTHKPLWVIDDPKFKIVLNNLNNNRNYPPKSNFKSDILPLINDLSETKKIYWMAGDIGISSSLPLFFHNEAENIWYIACGLGDTAKDAAIKVRLDTAGEVSFEAVSLAGQGLKDIEQYNLTYWSYYFSKGTGRRSVLDKVRRVILHKFFYTGIIVGFAICIIALMPKRFGRR